MLFITLVLLCSSFYGVTMASKPDKAYVVGLFPEPVYDKVDNDARFLPNTTIGEQSLRVKIRNPGSVSENVGFHAYLPDTAEMTSFSMTTSGSTYKAKKSDHKMAKEMLKKAFDEDHNAAVYVPNQLPDSYDDEIQSAANTVHIKGRHDMTFDLLYTENSRNMVEEGKKVLNRARINLDLYGTSVEDMSAELTSPNYPDSYSNSADVAWWVRVPDGKAVSLQVDELDIEECCDRLVIYDGASIHDNIIAEITGHIDDLTSTTYQSFTNSMFLRLISDCSKTSTGFKVTTSAVVIATSPMPPITTTPPFTNSTQPSFQCTGINSLYAYPHNFSYFSSPGYPYSYYDNLNCVWSIQAYYNYFVRLVVVEMDLEINYDYVYVYDGSSSNYPLLARLEGTDYVDLYSTGKYMYINFVTDGSVTKKGFSFKYTASYGPQLTTDQYPETTTNISSSCGDYIELYIGSDYITSPNYPDSYYSNMQCTWYIHGHYSDYVVKLYLFIMNLAYGDYVSVYDGSSNELLRRFSNGYYSSLAVYSNSPSMQIFFVSDDSYQAQGFQFQYSTYYSPQPTTVAEEVTTSIDGSSLCYGVIYLYADTGHNHSFSSYGYPSNYYDNMDCEWRIEANYYDYVVQLHVDDMDLESCCDSVRLYDGYSSSSRLIATLSGTRQGETYSSSGTYMFVKFSTDSTVTSKGFQLSYEAAPFSATTEIYPEFSTSYAEICSLGNNYTVYDNLFVSSPNYPGTYYSNAACSWTLTSYDPDYSLKIEFLGFSLERYDKVTVYNGPTQVHSVIVDLGYDSSYPSGYYYSTGQSMHISFTSDDTYESWGFYIYFTLANSVSPQTTEVSKQTTSSIEACTWGNELTVYSSVHVYSPNYPMSYISNLRCSWSFYTYYSDYVIEMHFDYLSLDQYDELTIYDGSSQYDKNLTNFTYGSQPRTVLSTGRHMFITFTSDEYYNSGGFDIHCFSMYVPSVQTTLIPEETTYYRETCTMGRNVTAKLTSYGYIQSPNYPGNYNSNSQCSWRIKSSNNKQIKIYFYELSLATNDTMIIYDESYDNGAVLAYLTYDSAKPGNIYSTGSYMYITFSSDDAFESTGFNIRYIASN